VELAAKTPPANKPCSARRLPVKLPKSSDSFFSPSTARAS
jgi:hypothetical protein